MAKKSKAKSLFEKVVAESAEDQRAVKALKAVQKPANNIIEQPVEGFVNILVPTADSAKDVDANVDDTAPSNSHENCEAKAVVESEVDPLKQFKDMLPVNANAADRQKLELYDKLYNECKAKTDENAKLSDKICKYVEQIDELKAEVEKLKSLNAVAEGKTKSLTKELEALKASDSSNTSGEPAIGTYDANKFIEALKIENSQLSSKLAQQEFEISTLKMALKQVPKQARAAQRDHVQNPNSVQYSYRNNGYSDWN